MSDHVQLPGTGENISADLLPDGSKVQRIKLITGADGVDGGNVAQGNPLYVNQSGVSASGALAALNASLVLLLDGASGFAVDLRGTFVGTITFQGTIDGTNWFPILALPVSSGVNTAAVSTATAPGAWVGPATGLHRVRAILTAYTSGTVTVTLRAMLASGVVFSMPSGAAAQSFIAGAGTALMGDAGTQYRANATGAASVLPVMSPSTAPAPLAVKAAAGRLLGLVLQNSSAGVRSVKFWNALVAGVTVGTNAALFEIDIPAGGAFTFNFEGGIGFATGITYAVTGAKGLLDNTTVGANDVTGVIVFA